MIPTPAKSWTFVVLLRLCFFGLCGWAGLTGCSTEQPTLKPQSPALELPRGSTALTPDAVEGVPNSLEFTQWLTAFKQTAEAAGLPYYLMGPEQQPSIAAVAFHYDDFEPQILREPRDSYESPNKKTKGTPGVSAWAALQKSSVAIVGSSFLSLVRALEPLGLLAIDGEQISPLEIHGYTRILGIDGQQRFGVVHRSAYDPEKFASALQAGPGVIEEGELDISVRDLERPRYFRSFVATCTDRVLIGVTLEPMNLRTLGEQFLQGAFQNHLGCDELINLAGDREAVFALRSDTQLLYHGDPNDKKAALIGFQRKQPSTE